MENKFKKGLILGGILAAVAAVGLVISKSHEGEELTDELQKDLKNVAKNLKKNLGHLQDVTKENFDELVANVVEEYVKDKGLAHSAQKALVHALEARWNEMEQEYQEIKEDMNSKNHKVN